MTLYQNTALLLQGLELEGGWNVEQRVPTRPGESGGAFSEGYLVRNEDGRLGWLKALDLSVAFASDDPARAIESVTSSFNFERDLLVIARGMDRVVSAITDAVVVINGFRQQYIIFELAAGDIRESVGAARVNLAWRLRTLHQVAIGIAQLHSQSIAHQDLKPSNVLVFGERSHIVANTKIGDLGRASRQGQAIAHDELPVAGDRRYAPPELLYGEMAIDWNARRRGADRYLLGMIVYMFTGATMTACLVNQLEPALHPRLLGGGWTGTYREVLPYVRSAFDRAILEITPAFPDECRSELQELLRYLCDPDPDRRGHQKNLASQEDSLGLQRFVTELDVLARKVALRRP